MIRKPLLLMFFTSLLFSENYLKELQDNGIKIVKEGKTIEIKREKSSACKKTLLNPEPLFGGNYSGKDVPEVCKKSFVTHVGVLQPMQLAKGITTAGEVEVLEYIKQSSEKPDEYILVDARTEKWYEQMTIPSAINIPFNQLHYEEDLEEDDFEDKEEYSTYVSNYKSLFKLLNIKETKEGLDFSKAKTALLFCNGSWCSQSPKAIMSLMNIGYPIEKLHWYRGGIQDWLIYDFTVEKNHIK